MRKFGSAACKSWASRFRRRGFWRDEKGVTIVEFAAVAAPFFFTLFAVLEVATIFFGGAGGGADDSHQGAAIERRRP